jgi:hypothetical protein
MAPLSRLGIKIFNMEASLLKRLSQRARMSFTIYNT